MTSALAKKKTRIVTISYRQKNLLFLINITFVNPNSWKDCLQNRRGGVQAWLPRKWIIFSDYTLKLIRIKLHLCSFNDDKLQIRAGQHDINDVMRKIRNNKTQ